MMCKWLENVCVCTLCRDGPHKRPEPNIMHFRDAERGLYSVKGTHKNVVTTGQTEHRNGERWNGNGRAPMSDISEVYLQFLGATQRRSPGRMYIEFRNLPSATSTSHES